jgi:hypothetical protein
VNVVPTGPPAGWYTDPTGRHALRFWDGKAWADRVVDRDAVRVWQADPWGRRPDWYADPTDRWPFRYFDGREWTSQVLADDPVSPAGPERAQPPRPDTAPADAATAPTATEAEELAHLEYVRGFAQRCFDDHLIVLAERDRLMRAVDERVAELELARAARAVPSAPPVTAAPTWPTPPTAPRPTAPAPAPVAPAPMAPAVRPPELPAWRQDVAAWMARTKATVRSDLAVHGLAYLGVLLLFAGVFGFVVFAFGEVSPDLRPVAEVSIPLALFGSARFLRSRGAPFVAVSLEALGGALVPVVVIASFVDGADVPPDLTGGTLAATLAVAMAGIAAVYAGVSARRPSSPLRYLVGPVAWIGVVMGAQVTVPGFRGGQSVARPHAWPLAITAVAVLLTAVWARRGRGALARATDVMILPGMAVVAALELAAVAAHGWPAGPAFVTSLAVFAVVELERDRLGPDATTVLQSLALAGALVAWGPDIGAAWVGAIAVPVYLAFLEWAGPRREGVVTLTAALVPGAAALVAATDAPGATLLAFSVASVWLHVRRAARPEWLPPEVPNDLVVALVPIGVAVGCYESLPFTDASVLVAGILLAVAGCVRLTAARADALYEWWLAWAGTIVLATTIVVAVDASNQGSGGLGWCALAALLVGAAVALSTAPAALRVWLGALSLGAAGIIAADVVGVAPVDVAFVAAVIGCALVIAAAWVRVPLMGHVGLVGHVTTVVAALAVTQRDGWLPVATLGLCATGWFVTTATQELASSPVTTLFERFAPRHGGAIAPVLAVVTVPYLTLAVLTQAGVFGDDPLARGSVSAAGSALAVAIVARVLVSRVRLTTILARAAFLFALVASVGRAGDTVAVLCTAAAVLAIVVLPRPRRELLMTWTAWALTAVVAVRAAYVADFAPDAWQAVLFAWGAVATTVALAFVRVKHVVRAELLNPVRQAWAPPLVLGYVASLAAVGAGIGTHPDAAGWWLVAAAALTLAWAVELPEPAITYATYAFGAASAALLLPWRPPENPWGLFLAAVVLTAVAATLGELLRSPDSPWWRRWEAPPLVVAVGLAAFVVASAEVTAAPAPVYAAVGGWALAVGIWRRQVAWFGVAVVLLDTGAGRAGPGWLALALTVTAAGATVAAPRAAAPARPVLQTVGAVCAAGAYAAAAWWLAVPVTTAVAFGAPLAMVPVVALALLVRKGTVALDWLAVWTAVGTVALIVAAELATAYPPGAAGIGVAVGVLLGAAACAVAAAPLARGELREGAAALVAVAIAIACASLEVDVTEAAVVAITAGFVATLFASALGSRRPASPWVRPSLLFAGIGSVTAVTCGIALMPSRDLLVAALALAGLELTLVGVVLRRLEVTACAPVVFLASWLVFASDALAGNPEWFTIPIGLTILVVEAFVRTWYRRRGEPVYSPTIAAVDLSGMAFVVGAALVQTIAVDIAYGLLAILLGVAVAAWGAVTQVRRRAAFGAATVVAAVLAMLALPLADLVPRLTGAALWITIAALGLAALLVAAFLEQGRRRVHDAIERLSDLTADWE